MLGMERSGFRLVPFRSGGRRCPSWTQRRRGPWSAISYREHLYINTYHYRSFFFCGCSCQVTLYRERGSHETRRRSRIGRITNCHVAFFGCRKCEGVCTCMPTFAEACIECIIAAPPGRGANRQKAIEPQSYDLLSPADRRIRRWRTDWHAQWSRHRACCHFHI
jgi:hypothetical protein